MSENNQTETLPQEIINSITGFNGSPHCDKISPESFYNSYIHRKNILINKKLDSYNKGRLGNPEKFRHDIELYEFFLQNKSQIIGFLKLLV